MQQLPVKFSSLETLVEEGWSLGTEQQRVAKRHQSSKLELERFYNLFAPLLEEVIDYLDGPDRIGSGEEDQRLEWLLCAMAEVSFSIEKFGGDESSYEGIEASRFVPVHDHPEGGLAVPVEYRSR